METPTLQRPEPMVDAVPTWTIDPNHSSLGFSVRHMMFATVRGRFNDFSGTIQFDPKQVARSSVSVTIQTASIDTGIGARDTHLRSADFFDTERVPTATFHSTSVEGHGKRFLMRGDLTIRGVTRQVSLQGQYQGRGINPSGLEVAGFEARGKLNRKEFGLNWNQALESGGVLVGDEITLTIDIQASHTTS